LARGVNRDAPERIAPERGGGVVERSGLSEGLWRPTGPPPEGPVERCRFGVLQEERDVADAQAAILKQGAREITSHLIEKMTE
jgi:hypothetical protein